MAEVSERGGVKEEEIELDLGLSIGGSSFRKSEKPKLDTRESRIQRAAVVVRSSSMVGLSDPESGVMDPQAKRKIQAMRRQEAKRKREEKRTRAQTGEQQQSPARKREKSMDGTNVVLSQGDNAVNVMNVNVNLNLSNAGQAEHHHYRTAVQYAPVQFVPYSNGFAYPCVVPCWAANGGGGGFRQFQANNGSWNNGCNQEQNGKTSSLNNGSPSCSSSTVSEHHRAASHEGGSSDTKSHSSRLNGSNGKNKAQSDHTATSHSIESNSPGNENSMVQPKEESAPEITEPVSQQRPPTPLKETKMEPTKPQMENSKPTLKSPSMPQMPYVATTGNGPKGKTIHGFLYRYSKSEISIVCVCHGSTFSPAEFVQHAGGTDVSQPLRHITVIPSAF